MNDRETLVAVRSTLRHVLAQLDNALVPTLAAPDSALIVVDAGHGGSDPGAKGVGVDGHQTILEKDVTLACSRALVEVLKEAGYRTMETRTSDTFVGLMDRAKMANDAKAFCFVSLHANFASVAARNGATGN